MTATPVNPNTPPLVRHGFALLESLRDEPALRVLASIVLIALFAGAVRWYWRERLSTGWPLALTCGLLRLVALVAVVIMVLGPERRIADEQTRPSKVVVLVDTSLSMSLPTGPATAGAPSESRSDATLRSLTESGLLANLAEQHQVVVVGTSGGGRWLFEPQTDPRDAATPATNPTINESNTPTANQNWHAGFTPQATETRLGDVLSSVLEEHTGGPLAGVVLVTDGQQNSGREPVEQARLLAERGTVLHTIGVGPESAGVNLAVRDLLVPAVAYPNDELLITAVVESTGERAAEAAAGLQASLFRRAEDAPPERAELLETMPVDTPGPPAADNASAAASSISQATLRFRVSPGAIGRYIYSVRLPSAPGELNTDDNRRDAAVEVVDRVLKVLLLAGGPTRAYRFLRDQLQRDDGFEVDVLLQSASAGALQDATNTLTAFPATDEELAEYDVIAAFDPNWQSISGGQQRIERAVSDDGSGLLYAPGPVHTPRWLGSRKPSRIKTLLPVVMPDRWLALSSSNATSRTRSPVELTPAGVEAEFLWIAGDRAPSLDAWREFAGFYRCFPVQTVKPGATVYARVNPTVGVDTALARAAGVLMAEQFYGAGRVMVLTSSELWRLRATDPAYFTTLTTKLLQHLAQGRLTAKAPGGSLLFERDRYRVGDTIVLRATGVEAATDQPLSAEIITPQGDVKTLPLLPNENQPGSWTAPLAAESTGRLQAIVRIPTGRELKTTAEVTVPTLERSGLVQNVTLLKQLAATGAGQYYPSFESAADGRDDLPPLSDATPSRAETTIVFGQPDHDFEQLVSRWALGLIAGCLITEWFLRRLNHLA